MVFLTFLKEKFDKICESVFGIAKNQQLCKNPHIQKALITLLPRLAAANKERFVSRHLAETMAYIYRCLQGRERDKYSALMAIGLIAVASGREIKPYLQNILAILRWDSHTYLSFSFLFQKQGCRSEPDTWDRKERKWNEDAHVL